MVNDQLAATLVPLFREGLRRSNVTESEAVVIFTDPEFEFPSYAAAALAAAGDLGAGACVVTVEGPEGLDTRVVQEAWRAADFVVGASSVPWIRHPTNMAALQAGTRTLMVAEPPASLRRMFPAEDVIRRTYSGARRLREACEIRIIDAVGTNLTMDKAGRKVNAQCGVADRPGRWDQWPSAMVDSTRMRTPLPGHWSWHRETPSSVVT